MRITDRVYLVGSGKLGSCLTDDYDCNVYLLDAGGVYVLIDSGAGIRPEAILQEIRRDGLDPRQIETIVLTHAHSDHSGGAAALSRMTGASVVGSSATAALLRDVDEVGIGLEAARQAGIYPADYRVEAIESIREVFFEDILAIGDLTLEIIQTPGHSADSISCYIEQLGTMFCGDLLFEGGRIAMQVAPDFSLYELARSVEILAGYEIHALMPGHLSPLVGQDDHTLRQVLKQFRALQIPRNLV
ncbi:MBL fold metallo-hydrolase [Paenibacillus sp. SAF-054]|uniref:MBL fold metallo-hydrolase n=1 Tax=unclassified Paenibacillus TaxID=185978 RepID=UPI003F80AFBF